MIIEEEWIFEINLTDCATFPPALIKREKSKKIPHDTRQYIHKIAMGNGWNLQVSQVLCEEHDGMFHLKLYLLIILLKPVEPSHKWVLEIFKYQDP